ncbi:GNAT family N-acetyltransferase [candidate division WWE3 bacterium]|nr:GNAT family N-acetyltransferase [candidate division WWE3 bacterium]
MPSQLTFKGIQSIQPGTLFTLLIDSYQRLLMEDRQNAEKYVQQWHETDSISFTNPDTIGKYVVVSFIENEPIGFITYDPRNFPEYGIIGQNCIIPEYKGNGYGTQQLEYVLSLFSQAGCTSARVSTGSIDFFKPAQKMYQNAGFKLVDQKVNEIWGHPELFYEKIL